MSESNTREKIIQAMYHLSAEKGYDRSSIGLICDEVGITKPSVYFYFKNKEEIYLESIKLIFDAGDAWVPNMIIGNEASFYDLILNFGYLIIDNYRSDIERQKFMSELNVQATRLESVNLYLTQHRTKRKNNMKEFVRKGFEVGFFSEDKTVENVAELIDIVLTEFGNRTFLEPDFDRKHIWKMLIDSLRAK